MENVSTGVLEKNKKHYLRSKDNAEKWYDVSRHIQLHMSKYKRKWRYTIHYVKPTAQLLFKSQFAKGGSTCRRQVVNPRNQTPQGQSVAKLKFLCTIYPSWVATCDIKGSDSTVLNLILYSERGFRGKNILGGERLQNTKYLVFAMGIRILY